MNVLTQRSEIFKAVNMKATGFMDMTPCSLTDILPYRTTNVTPFTDNELSHLGLISTVVLEGIYRVTNLQPVKTTN
jgi:hypothetical protein